MEPFISPWAPRAGLLQWSRDAALHCGSEKEPTIGFDWASPFCGAIFITSTKDGAYSTCYTGKIRRDHVSGGLLVPFPPLILEDLSYFGLFRLVLRKEADLLLTVIVFKSVWRWTAIRWLPKTPLCVIIWQINKCSASWKYQYELESTFMTVGVASQLQRWWEIFVFFRTKRERAVINVIRGNFDQHCSSTVFSGIIGGVKLDILFP